MSDNNNDGAEIKAMNAARNFPENTCPASRHTAMITEHLLGTPLPDCNRGNKCPWSEECKANDWRETCRRCGLRSQGSGQ